MVAQLRIVLRPLQPKPGPLKRLTGLSFAQRITRALDEIFPRHDAPGRGGQHDAGEGQRGAHRDLGSRWNLARFRRATRSARVGQTGQHRGNDQRVER